MVNQPPYVSTSLSLNFHTNLSKQLTSRLPTSLSTSLPSSSSHNRTSIIAGSTAAAILIFIILGGVFLHHRHKLRQRQALFSIRDRTREGPREGRGLLAGEDFDLDESHPVQMRSLRDSELIVGMTPQSAGTSPPPSFHRPRASETGSIFREEEVWPPPAEFVDPFLTNVRRNQEVDLGRIVDDIMGPAEGNRPGHTPTSSTSSSGSEAERLAGAGAHRTHRTSDSDTSYTGLLDSFRDRRQSQVSSLYTDPFSTSREVMPGKGKSKSTAVHNPLPPGAAPAILDSGHDPMAIAPGVYSLQPAGTSAAASGVSASKPKKPSPLTRVMSTASNKMGDKTRLWLDRKVKKEPLEGGRGGVDANVDDGIGVAY
jgi:hypothetical protein